MPRMRGNATDGDFPSRVKISEWLTPAPRTLISDQPGRATGVGTSQYLKTSGPPASETTTAFMFPHLAFRLVDCVA